MATKIRQKRLYLNMFFAKLPADMLHCSSLWFLGFPMAVDKRMFLDVSLVRQDTSRVSLMLKAESPPKRQAHRSGDKCCQDVNEAHQIYSFTFRLLGLVSHARRSVRVLVGRQEILAFANCYTYATISSPL